MTKRKTNQQLIQEAAKAVKDEIMLEFSSSMTDTHSFKIKHDCHYAETIGKVKEYMVQGQRIMEKVEKRLDEGDKRFVVVEADLNRIKGSKKATATIIGWIITAVGGVTGFTYLFKQISNLAEMVKNIKH